MSKLLNKFQLFSSWNTCRFFKKPAYTMNKIAYFKQLPDDDQTVHITFQLKNEEYQVDRIFNFSRKLDEKIEVSVERIKTNVEKEFNKKLHKLKKLKKKVDNVEVTAEVKEVPQIDIKLCNDDIEISNKTYDEIFSNISNYPLLSFYIMSCKYEVRFNYPWVHLISLPSCILAGFYVYPSKLELQFAEKNHCEFQWFRGQLPKTKKDEDIIWEAVGDNHFQYLVQPTDIAYKLKVQCTPKNSSSQIGPPLAVVSKTEVQAGPGPCPFEIRHAFTQDACVGNEFRVVSYNILADLYCDSDYSRKELFPYCPPYALNIDYRKLLFTKEIVGYNGDIVCLQEVDSKIFDLDLQPLLKELNYEGFFQVKGTTAEGLATFWNSARFELADTYGINIGENIQVLPTFEVLWNKIKSNPSLVSRVCERSTAVSVVVVKPKEMCNKYLLIASTHLYFHPDADHVRLLQIAFSMLYVQHVHELTKQKYNLTDSDVALVFCGDFNSVPECGIKKLMTEKYVPEDFIDWESNKEEAVKNVSLTQPFNMKSSYESLPYTNFTVGFKECIDYIFYESDKLTVKEVIPLPTHEELCLHQAIPSVVFPSDHIALVTKLKWKDSQ